MKKPCLALMQGLLFAAIAFSSTAVEAKCACIKKKKELQEWRRLNLNKTTAYMNKIAVAKKRVAQKKLALAKHRN